MARIVLTEKFTTSAKRMPQAGQADYPDAFVPGLALRVGRSGKRSFVLVTRYSGSSNPTRRTLREHPVLTLDMAREPAVEWLRLLQAYEDEKRDLLAKWETRDLTGRIR